MELSWKSKYTLHQIAMTYKIFICGFEVFDYQDNFSSSPVFPQYVDGRS